MRVPLLDLRREYESIANEIDTAWKQVFDSMRLIGGPNVRALEHEFAAYVGVDHACAVASGTDALALALQALGLHAGDRVVLAANSFVAALEAVFRCGASPVLVDAAKDGFGPDFDAVQNVGSAAAVIVVHLYGHMVDPRRSAEICAALGAWLVEDASHAHGAARAGRRAGAVGAIACFSAGVVKNLGAYGEAGLVTTSNAELARRVRLLRHHGQEHKNEHLEYGGNSRMDELQAAVLRIKLRRLDQRNQRRRQIAAYYGDRLSSLPLILPPVGTDEQPAYHQYVIRTAHRDELRAFLADNRVETGIHYPLALHRQPAWRQRFGDSGLFPNAERLAAEVLSLPVFPDLTDAEVEWVCEQVRRFFLKI